MKTPSTLYDLTVELVKYSVGVGLTVYGIGAYIIISRDRAGTHRAEPFQWRELRKSAVTFGILMAWVITQIISQRQGMGTSAS